MKKDIIEWLADQWGLTPGSIRSIIYTKGGIERTGKRGYRQKFNKHSGTSNINNMDGLDSDRGNRIISVSRMDEIGH